MRKSQLNIPTSHQHITPADNYLPPLPVVSFYHIMLFHSSYPPHVLRSKGGK